MGLKWFRARLSMEKEVSKIPAMTGLYRRISYFEPAIKKNVEVSLSTAPPLIVSDSTSSDDNQTVKDDRSKVDLTSQTVIIDSEEITVKDIDKKLHINNHSVENVEPSISTKDPNVKEPSARGEELNKINKDQNMSDTKRSIYSDNELVI